MTPKQIIVMRTDLGMRKGKMIAQGAHASIAFLTERISQMPPTGYIPWSDSNPSRWAEAEDQWLKGRFTKICVRADSEEQILRIAESAKEAQVRCHVITDAGLTEFHGEPTVTCCALGPDYPEFLDPITGDLKLL